MTVLDEITKVAADLRYALDEIDRLTLAIGGDPRNGELGAESRWRRARLEAHATSVTDYGKKRTVDEHNNAADWASFDEWAVYNALVYELRAVKERSHTYRQVLSALQTAARVEADLAR